MRSFLCVDHKEGKWVQCELENIPDVESTPDTYGEVECFYISLPFNLFYDKQFSIQEGDIYVVEHNGYEVTEVLELAEDEKERRTRWLQEIS